MNLSVSLLLLLSLTSFRLGAEILVTGVNTNTDAAYGADASNSDLVNTGSPALTSATLTRPADSGSSSTAHNDGTVGTANNLSSITFWNPVTVGQTYSITYDLNTTSNTLGYDITSIQTIHGWTNGASGTQKNQNYEVFVSTVGSAAFTSLATVAYLPFDTTNQAGSSKVNITEVVTGKLASGVDQIRFTYTITGGGSYPSPTIREIDVFGYPTSNGPDIAPPAPNPMTFATAPYASGANSIAMTASAAADPAGVEYYFKETSGNAGGNDSGWQSSRVYEDTGLTTGLVYTYTVAARDLSANQNPTTPSAGFSATAAASPVITLTSPTSRQIVQRSAANTGAVGISGTYTNVAASIQARAVVMTGTGNSGTTTDWQTINVAPTGGSFTGTLIGVQAGGWYQIEVRGLVDGAPGLVTVVSKVGIGDIFVTAGQSNSANYGTSNYVPTDDRVSARTTVNGSTWVLATDPIPIATGTGGSVWTRLGDQLATALDIPIGFIAVGVGSTQVNQWLPGTSNYNNLLKPAVQSFPANGFRAFLWHQGESDSLANVTAATHASRLATMIAQSRLDAGWNIPWYLAEGSFHPNSLLSQEVPVAAGQRLAVHSDPLVFLGPSTDEFHLEDASGGKLIDTVHFNAAGLLDHATQWKEILLGLTTITPKNPGFEDNHTLSISNRSALADGESYLLTPLSNNDSPMVLDWRILSSTGVNAADGANGVHNPTTGTYAAAIDSANGGVLPNMSGKHVAMLDGGSAGNYFLHSTRALALPYTTYTLTVALGVRDDPATFGTARLEITAKGVVVASGTFNKVALNTLKGSDAAGSFTDGTLTWTTGATVAANQPLAIRVVKEGGVGTVLDFDNVRFTATPGNVFNSWISNPAFGLDSLQQGFAQDPDGDGIKNGVEAWFGTHPGQFNAGLTSLTNNGTVTTFTHPHNNSPPLDLSGSYQWSLNLADWYASGSGPIGGPTVTFSPVTLGTTTTVTATASTAVPSIFLRACASQN